MSDPVARGSVNDETMSLRRSRLTATPRFGQLTYSSFDRGGGRSGGWQVQETSGDLSPAEERFLVSGVATTLDDGRRIPQLPTDAELEALPRRLLYAPWPEAGAAAYWHTTPAGQDSSGRPGNVFAHVVLDRRPTDTDLPLRPSDFAYSPLWLRPFGPQAVRASRLADVPSPPWPYPVLDRAATIGFLVEEATWRPGLLAALLDGVHAALSDPSGPSVVLATDEPVRGLRWIAALCHLMSPGTSRRLYWSSLERPSGLLRLRDKGVHLAVLPESEMAAVEDDPRLLVIVDGEETVELGDLHLPKNGEHRTRPQGRPIPVTPYSVVAAVVLQEAGVAERVLAYQDVVAAEAGDRDLPSGWPMAMAVLEVADDLKDARVEARELLVKNIPANLSPEMRDRVSALLGGGVARPQTAKPVAVSPPTVQPQITIAFPVGPAAVATQTALRDEAVRAYVARGIDDREWLVSSRGDEPRPEIPVEVLDPELVDRACATLDNIVAEAALVADPAVRLTFATTAVRLIEFGFDVGLNDVVEGTNREFGNAVDRVVDCLIGPMLLDGEHGPELVRRAGALPEAVQRLHVRCWVDRCLDGVADLGPPGHRVHPDVLAWLFTTPPEPPSAATFRTRNADIPATLVEAAVQATRILPDPSAFRAVAAWGVLGMDQRPDWLAAGPPLSAAELRALVTAYDPLLPVVPLLEPALLALPDGDDLRAISERLRTDALFQTAAREDPVAASVAAAAELRFLTGHWSERRGGGAPVTAQLLEAAVRVLALPHRGKLTSDVTDAVIAARVAEVVEYAMGPPPARPGVSRWLQTEATPAGVVSERVVEQLTSVLRHNVVDVALAAQLGAAQPGPSGMGPRHRALADAARLRVVVQPHQDEPLLDHLVRRMVHKASEVQVMDLVRHVRARTPAYRGRAEPDPADDAVAQQWWAKIGVAGPAQVVFVNREAAR